MNENVVDRVTRLAVCALVVAMLIVSPLSAQDNLVANGSFDLDTDGDGVPDHWATSGTTGSDITVIDIMGNTLKDRAVELTATPVYFLSNTLTAEELKSVLSKK